MANIFNRNIGNDAHQALKENSAQGIRVFTISPSGGWVIITNKNKIIENNIPSECLEKLKLFQKNGEKILCIAFHPRGGNRWSIITSRRFFNRDIPEECHQRMTKLHDSGKKIINISFPAQGNNAWVVLTKNAFYARNIPDECYQIMRNLHQGRRRVQSVVFDIDRDGWVVLAGDYFFARNVDDELYEQLRKFNRNRWTIKNVVFDTDRRGWSVSANRRFSHRLVEPIRDYESNVAGKSIWQAMRDNNVPGVAVAVVINNRIAWSCGYGHLKTGKSSAVHPESIFQAASISKVLATLGILRAERLRLLDIDDNIISRLTSWNPTFAQGIRGSVSIRQLLAHIGGCNPGGYGGYSIGSQIPTLQETLSGAAPAKSGHKAIISSTPGSAYDYTGHGFEILHQVLEDVTNDDFDNWMQRRLLSRIGMNDTSFTLTPSINNNLSAGHNRNGQPITGDRRIYPESAAAGAYTNVLDLARMIIFINRGGRRVLNRSQITDMLTSQHSFSRTTIRGLGVILNSRSTGGLNFRYSHGGTNKGFLSTFVGFPNRNTGVVVMTNGDGGIDLRNDIANAVINTYGWATNN